LSNNILLDTIVDSFNNGDELKPMRHMRDMLALLSCWKEGATLVKQSLRTKIKESSDMLIPIVIVVITVIATFFFPDRHFLLSNTTLLELTSSSTIQMELCHSNLTEK
jgi:hypothetical protein